MKKAVSLMSIFIIFSMIIQLFCYTPVFAEEKEQNGAPVWYLEEAFGSESSWDKALAWNGTNYSLNSGQVNGVELTDGSDWLKSEGYRAINDITSGIITLDFDFTMDKCVDDVGFRLLNDTKTVFGIVTKGSDLYLEQPNGENIFLHNYSATLVRTDKTTYIQAHLDFDSKKIIDVYVNGEKCAENKSFATNADKANGFDIETDEKSRVLLVNQRVYIYSGYIAYECFFNAHKVAPIEWEFESNGGSTSVYTVNCRNSDRYSMQMNSARGDIRAIKRFNPSNGHIIFEIRALQPKKRDGVEISVRNGENALLSVTTDGVSYCYKDINNAAVPFYTYTENVWYTLKFDLDIANSKADIYLNNKLKAEKITLPNSIKSIDNIFIDSQNNDRELVIDDVKLYNKKIIPNDYVPAPQKPEKDDDFLIGMQMCPLWTEGLFTKSWTYVKSAPDRMPILGAYDEGSPEVSDWFNKWMIDHGYDFQWVCTYPNWPMSFNGYQPPIKPDMVREVNSVYEGYMNSEYSNQIKFAIMMENSYLSQGSVHREGFFDSTVPFWIEYYFKDDRYLKVDGRPIVSIYVMDNFLKMFEGMNGLTGADAAKAGVDKFKQMCIDAGVGEPYLLSQLGQSSYIGKDYAYYSQCGIDAINTYGYDYTVPVLKQKIVLQKGLENSKQYKVDTVPCLQPRLGHEAWSLKTGFKATQDEFEAALKWVKDEFGEASHSKLSKQLFMTSTWDEYGEGHIMCPNVGDGFMYLDAVRNVFAKDVEHEEAIPTEAQKQRVNTRVVQDRKETIVTENKLPKIPDEVKTGWYFNDAKDVEVWGANSGVGTMAQTAEGLSVTPTAESPTITIKGKQFYDISDVTYIKIRMKPNSSSAGGYATWTTYTDGEYDEFKRMYFSTFTKDSDTMKDYYIPVGQSVRWKGALTGLRLNLGMVSDYSEPFVIESIEFLKDKNLEASAKIKIDDALYVMQPEPVIKNGTVMIPIREVCREYGASVSNFTIDSSYLITYGSNQTVFKLGEKTAIKNNAVIGVGEPPYTVSDIVNDTVYVPANLLSEALGKKVTYDAENRILEIESAKKKAVTVERKILKAFEFDNGDTISHVENINSITYQDSKMIAKTGGYPIFLTSAFGGIELNKVKVIAIKMTSSVNASISVLYSTYEDPAITADKASRMFPVYAGENIIEIPTADLYEWKGTMAQLRVHPVNKSATVEMDWIRFLGDPIEGKGAIEDMSSCVSITDEAYSWEFDKNTALDGWNTNKSLGNISLTGGELSAKIVGKSPAISTCKTLDLDADEITEINFGLTNKSAGTVAKMYFQTSESNIWSEENSFEIAVTNDDLFSKSYTIKTSDNKYWNGKITKLMLVPTQYKGAISIDYIRLKLSKKTQ